jgi:hypothetical protein
MGQVGVGLQAGVGLQETLGVDEEFGGGAGKLVGIGMEVGVGVGEVLEESVDGLEGQQRDAGLVGELAVLTAGVSEVGRFLPPSLHKYNWLQRTRPFGRFDSSLLEDGSAVI